MSKVSDPRIEFDTYTDQDIKCLDCELTSYVDAEAFARALREELWQTFLAIDRGPGSEKRYSVVRAPLIGEHVVKTDGDLILRCGYITKIMPSFSQIETSTGDVFCRHELTGVWVQEGGWCVVSMWVNEGDDGL